MYIFQKIIPQIYEPGFQMELKTQISFMQARELRIATKRFKMSFLEANELFVKYKIDKFIFDCEYEFLAEGDDCVFSEIEKVLSYHDFVIPPYEEPKIDDDIKQMIDGHEFSKLQENFIIDSLIAFAVESLSKDFNTQKL